MALNTITTLKLPNGKVIALVDWTDMPLFSTVDLGSGFTDQEIELFQYTSGQSVPGVAAPAISPTLRSSTANDTNLSTPGEMSTTEELLIYAIKPEVGLYIWDEVAFETATVLGAGANGFPGTTYEAVTVLSQFLMIRLKISEKVYAEAGFGYYVPGFGPHGVASIVPGNAAASSRTMANSGLPSQEAVRSFALPNHIGGQEKYSVILINEAGQAVPFGKSQEDAPEDNTAVMAKVRVYLEGLYKRPTA